MFGRSLIQANRVTERCVRVPAPPGGLRQIGSDPMKVVNDAVEESTNLLSAVLRFAASLVAPEEDKGTVTTHKLRSPDNSSDELQITAVEECNVQVLDLIRAFTLFSLTGNLYAVRKKGLYWCIFLSLHSSLVCRQTETKEFIGLPWMSCSCWAALHFVELLPPGGLSALPQSFLKDVKTVWLRESRKRNMELLRDLNVKLVWKTQADLIYETISKIRDGWPRRRRRKWRWRLRKQKVFHEYYCSMNVQINSDLLNPERHLTAE